MDELRATANAIVDEGTIAVLGSGISERRSEGSGTESRAPDGAQFVVGVPEGVDVDAGDVVAELAAAGGGPPDFAGGGGPDVDRLDEALASAPDLPKRALDA